VCGYEEADNLGHVWRGAAAGTGSTVGMAVPGCCAPSLPNVIWLELRELPVARTLPSTRGTFVMCQYLVPCSTINSCHSSIDLNSLTGVACSWARGCGPQRGKCANIREPSFL